VYLSWTYFNTVSKRTKTSFHVSLITLEYHRLHPKCFLTLWYVWRKPWFYLAPTLTPALNGWKWDSTWAKSSRSSIGCIQNDFKHMVHSAQTVQLFCMKIRTISKWIEMSFDLNLITLETIRCVQNDFYVWRKPCTYLALTLTPSQNGPKRDLTWPTSPRSFISASKTIYEPMVCSVQTVHPSCVKISTVTKQTETSLHLSLVI
jgi:hypothetical protein